MSDTFKDWLRSFPAEPYIGQFKEDGKTYIKRIDAGTILHTNDGDVHLVGDVNGVLGVCEDCLIFKEEDITAISHIKKDS